MKIKEWIKEHKEAVKIGGGVIIGVVTTGLAVYAGLKPLKSGISSLTITLPDLIKTDLPEVATEFLIEKGDEYALQDLGDLACIWIQRKSN